MTAPGYIPVFPSYAADINAWAFSRAVHVSHIVITAVYIRSSAWLWNLSPSGSRTGLTGPERNSDLGVHFL